MQKPTVKPARAAFGSGPCPKRPGWTLDALADAPVGRSHRSAIGKAKLKQAIDETKALLGLPDDYLVAIVPASDTGAVEMVMWSMLGSRPVDICHWETFGGVRAAPRCARSLKQLRALLRLLCYAGALCYVAWNTGAVAQLCVRSSLALQRATVGRGYVLC